MSRLVKSVPLNDNVELSVESSIWMVTPLNLGLGLAQQEKETRGERCGSGTK